MSGFFVNDEHFINRRQLNAVTSTPFDLSRHVEDLAKMRGASQSALNTLLHIDKSIVTGLALGVAAFTFSVILPVSSLVVVGFSYAAYQFGKRDRAFADYQASLENCVSACQWALGKNVTEDLMNHREVQLLVDYLAPLVTNQQLIDWIDDRYEERFVEGAEAKRSKITYSGVALTTRQSQLYYGIYGYQQGSAMNILLGLWEITKQALGHAREKAQAFYQANILPRMNPSV